MKNSRVLSHISIIVILILTVWLQFYVKGWKKNRVIEWDTMVYYSYLPAAFIHHDLTMEFKNTNPKEYSQKFWSHRTPHGGLVVKMSSGMAFIYAPFFFIAHTLAKPLGFEADGYSLPYRMALALGAIFYLALGLFVLRKFLRKYFSEITVSITLLLTAFATNLWYYSTIEPAMSHVYNFTFFVLFIALLDDWLKDPKFGPSICLGLISGIISLIRPTNALIGIFFLLWGISNISTLRDRIQYLFKKWDKLLVIAGFAILVWVPQMVYWKIQAGQFFYYSYGGEGFFFLKPHIIDGLFSFRKGWFIYTPIMFVATLGIFLLPKYVKGSALAISVYLSLNIYIIFSWWSWWYGGSYGARPMIESYAIMAIPLAAVVEYFTKSKRWIKYLSFSIFFLFISHGIFQTFQYYYGAIHWDSMTKKAYFHSFGKLKPSGKFWEYLEKPNYKSAHDGLDEKDEKSEKSK
ncbi:MAG TPA: hypothetical protein PK563_14945 [Tenuifilaceae bacterium]|nr:hypothetical protein [Tenuifilaceae bacterium]